MSKPEIHQYEDYVLSIQGDSYIAGHVPQRKSAALMRQEAPNKLVVVGYFTAEEEADRFMRWQERLVLFLRVPILPIRRTER